MKKFICPLKPASKPNRKELLVRNISPVAESFVIKVFVDIDFADCTTPTTNNSHYLGEIYVYGFGQGIDEHGNIVVDLIYGQQVTKKADKFDAIISLEPLAKLYKTRPQSIALLFVATTPDNYPIDDDLFNFEQIVAEYD